MNLKIFRRILALTIFALFCFAFLGLGDLSNKIAKVLTYLQFMPSIIKKIDILGNAPIYFSLGFLIILVATLISGRLYCSVLCPLGILQDLFSFVGIKARKKKPLGYSKPYNWLRYSILGISVITFASGIVTMLNLLDPYSIFGRLTTNIAKPIMRYANNLLVPTLEQHGIYTLSTLNIHTIDAVLLTAAIIFSLALLIVAIFRGRIYCNSICPVGTILGLCSKYSFFNIKIDQDKCVSCKLCEKVCKSECIDAKEKTIDTSRCVSCFNCLSACNRAAISYDINTKNRKEKTTDKSINHSRRNFIAQLSGSTLGLATLFSLPAKILAGGKNPTSKLPVTPPGSLSIEHFTDNCTGCHLCVSKCPVNVLKPAFLEYGITGINQPRMDYDTGFCQFECNICSQVCPTNAITPISVKEKKLTQLGVVELKLNDCIVIKQGTACGACSEHCPTKAVYMVPYKDNITKPQTNQEICIGCGACEHICPAKPKAIHVNSNPVHKKAKKPQQNNPNVKKKNLKIESTDDFPF